MSGARQRGRTRSVTGLALAAVLALGGCSAADDDPAASEQPSGQASEQPSGPASEDEGDGGDGDSGGAGVEDGDLDEVLVEQTVAQPGAPDDTATIGVRSLRVEGEVMVLELAVTPDFASVSDGDTVSLYEIFSTVDGTFDPTLLDRVNLKRYSIVEADNGLDYASDPVYTAAGNGESVRAFAVFAAPEDDVDVIDVVLADPWPAFTDVPVER